MCVAKVGCISGHISQVIKEVEEIESSSLRQPIPHLEQHCSPPWCEVAGGEADGDNRLRALPAAKN